MSTFAMRDFLGAEKGYFSVEPFSVPVDEPTTSRRETSRLVFILDMSGSMWGQVDHVKSNVKKLLTLEECRSSDTLITVASFSSEGDLKIHAEDVRAEDFMAVGSPHIAAVDSLRTRGLTCVSQGLQYLTKIDGKQTVAILLSDGYANDRSPGDEKRKIDKILDDLRTKENLTLNTVSFGGYADFTLLSYVATVCGGVCLQTPSARELYDSLYGEARSAFAPSKVVKVDQAGADVVVAWSVKSRKIVGVEGDDLILRGFDDMSDVTVRRYRRIEKGAFDASFSHDPLSALVLARYYASVGKTLLAKRALLGSGVTALVERHAKALTSQEVANMIASLDEAIFNGFDAEDILYGLQNASIKDVMSVLDEISEHRADVLIDVDALRDGYVLRGVSSVSGSRQPDGTILKPDYSVKSNARFAKLGDVIVSRTSPNVNVLLTRPANLVDRDGNVIEEVAGVDLRGKLFTHNNYTLVGEGSPRVKSLMIKVTSKRAFHALVDAKVIEDAVYDPEATYEVALEGRPVIPYNVEVSGKNIPAAIKKLVGLKMVASILDAMAKSTSAPDDKYTDVQVEALKRHGLSVKLNSSNSTCNPYTDRAQALADGELDTYTSYSVSIVDPNGINPDDLHSANAFLKRRFAVPGDAKAVPVFGDWWNPGFKVEVKSAAKLKLDERDDLMFDVYENLLLGDASKVVSLMSKSGVDAALAFDASDLFTRKVTGDKAAEIFADLRKDIKRAVKDVYRESITPVTLYTGALGSPPDDFDPTPLSADQVRAKYKNYSVSKKEEDAFFYEGHGLLMIVTSDVEYFSTPKGVAVAKALSA